MKKLKFVIMAVCIVFTLSACAKDKSSDTQNIVNKVVPKSEIDNNEMTQKEKEDNVENISDEINDNSESSQTTMIREQERVLNGYEYVDGREIPVQITMSINKILHGEDAYNELRKQNSDIEQPKTNEEYVVVTFNVSYDEGEAEELFFMENRASMEMAGLYFSLSNASSNAQDVTAYLTDNIYDISLEERQECQGSVAFLQERENVQPLYFIGFENIIEFSIND